LTQAEIARLVGISQGAVSRISRSVYENRIPNRRQRN
jgi:DNA-directed RNA polymerase specialized sigma subunit